MPRASCARVLEAARPVPGTHNAKIKGKAFFSFPVCLKDLPASSLLTLFKVSRSVLSPVDLVRLLGGLKIKPWSHLKAFFRKKDSGRRKKPSGNLTGSSFSLSSHGSALSLRRDKSLIDNDNSNDLHLGLQFPVFHMHYPTLPPVLNT